MSNVLTNEAKRVVWGGYRARLITAGSLMAILIAFLCALSLLPSYVALHVAGSTTADGVEASSGAATEEDRAAVASLRTLVASLAPLVATTTSPTGAIGRVLSLRPSGISIDHITYTKGEVGTIMLVGSAATREAINTYRQQLSADPLFKSVSIPVGDLAGAPGARFSITLSGTF